MRGFELNKRMVGKEKGSIKQRRRFECEAELRSEDTIVNLVLLLKCCCSDSSLTGYSGGSYHIKRHGKRERRKERECEKRPKMSVHLILPLYSH